MTNIYIFNHNLSSYKIINRSFICLTRNFNKITFKYNLFKSSNHIFRNKKFIIIVFSFIINRVIIYIFSFFNSFGRNKIRNFKWRFNNNRTYILKPIFIITKEINITINIIINRKITHTCKIMIKLSTSFFCKWYFYPRMSSSSN